LPSLRKLPHWAVCLNLLRVLLIC